MVSWMDRTSVTRLSVMIPKGIHPGHDELQANPPSLGDFREKFHGVKQSRKMKSP